MLGRILMLAIGGGMALGITRYTVDHFISGTTFSANVTSGNITRIDGTTVAFTGSLIGNNTVHYLFGVAILIAILCAIFMTVKKRVRKV